jgi:hypothetical protein
MSTDAWITPSAAAKVHGIPLDLINQSIMYGRLEARRICGECVIPKAEVTALALRLKGGRCDACE